MNKSPAITDTKVKVRTKRDFVETVRAELTVMWDAATKTADVKL